jgi:hypothetical protein
MIWMSCIGIIQWRAEVFFDISYLGLRDPILFHKECGLVNQLD